MDIENWPLKAAFYERVECLELHGLHFQHVALCQRRAWMYLHNINFAQWNERVKIGTAKHITSYSRDKSTLGLFGLAPDRVDWQQRIICENKGTGGAKEASNNQTAFYAVMLSIASGQSWQASEILQQLAKQHNVPQAKKIPLCSTCSFAKFCGFE